jgi:hypothetical protein
MKTDFGVLATKCKNEKEYLNKAFTFAQNILYDQADYLESWMIEDRLDEKKLIKLTKYIKKGQKHHETQAHRENTAHPPRTDHRGRRGNSKRRLGPPLSTDPDERQRGQATPAGFENAMAAGTLPPAR